MAKSKTIVKYRKPSSMNIGAIIFFIIFLYMCYNVFSYVTQSHVSVYEIQTGEISKDSTYTGLILRDETVCVADHSGYINYYRKDASKVSTSSVVYTLDTNGDVYNKIKEANSDGTLIDKEGLKEIENTVDSYITGYSDMSFYHIYNFKTSINSQVKEDISLAALDKLGDYVSYATNANTFFNYQAPVPGVITYYTDGFEDVTIDNFTSAMFQQSDYVKTDLRSQDSIASGAAVYKLLTDDNWNVVIPIDATLAASLSEDSVIEISFTKDKTSMWANYELLQREGQTYLILKLKSGMVRFADDRYISVELKTDNIKGLKIPNSSITKKDFFVVPKEFFSNGGDSDAEGLVIEKTDDKGNVTTDFVETELYYETEDSYYLNQDSIKDGDAAIKSDSNDRYTIRDTASLEGVYNINRGYAVFKQISILYQNEEYSIIDTKTNYGVALYDHIALDSTTIQEGELIN